MFLLARQLQTGVCVNKESVELILECLTEGCGIPKLKQTTNNAPHLYSIGLWHKICHTYIYKK